MYEHINHFLQLIWVVHTVKCSTRDTSQCLNPELAKHETAQQWKISYLTHTSSTDYLREMAHINQQN